jgi:hypothetical protein
VKSRIVREVATSILRIHNQLTVFEQCDLGPFLGDSPIQDL